MRWTLLAALAVAPLAFGAVHPPAYWTLYAIFTIAGVVSWIRARTARSLGAVEPELPGLRLLLLLHGLVLLQLVPLPHALLRLLSPGTALRTTGWHPVSVSPIDTVRGLAFLIALTLLYATVFREFGEPRWRRRLYCTVVMTGVILSIVGMAQAAYGMKRIYGIWQPRYDWAVFGPYVNRNHFAGYLVMAVPLAFAFVAEGAQDTAARWRRRRVGWLALFDPEAGRAVRWAAVAVVVAVGLLASQSRGGLLAFGVGTVLLVALLPLRRGPALVLGLALAGLPIFAWMSLNGAFRGVESGFEQSRLMLWRDTLRLVPDFPLLGVGLNAFGTAYRPYQTVWRYAWVEQAHNEYLQVLLDLGLVGAALVGALLLVLLRGAREASRHDVLAAGVLGALLSASVHHLFDFNWQIPANAATYAALAGVAMAAHAQRTHSTAEREAAA